MREQLLKNEQWSGESITYGKRTDSQIEPRWQGRRHVAMTIIYFDFLLIWHKGSNIQKEHRQHSNRKSGDLWSHLFCQDFENYQSCFKRRIRGRGLWWYPETEKKGSLLYLRSIWDLQLHSADFYSSYSYRCLIVFYFTDSWNESVKSEIFCPKP